MEERYGDRVYCYSCGTSVLPGEVPPCVHLRDPLVDTLRANARERHAAAERDREALRALGIDPR